MPTRKPARKSSVVLILVDVINDFKFPNADALLRNALPIAPRIGRIKKRAHDAGVPVIYVNDNFGDWHSDAKKLVAYCTGANGRGAKFVTQVAAQAEDYFVLKPMHSAFYQTPLDTLLKHLGASTLVLAGIATNSCIVYTAHDAKMRDFKVVILSDCCAARTIHEHRQALNHVEAMASAKIIDSPQLHFRQLKTGTPGTKAK